MEQALFALGCFWSPEVMFRKTAGVKDVEVGYAGGHTENPTYDAVCRGDTGHAECVHITFNPDQVSYTELLDIFFGAHNPAARQSPKDQYRSAIFAYGDGQRAEAEGARDRWNESGRYQGAIQTFIEPAPVFWRAEEYHQRYLEKSGAASI